MSKSVNVQTTGQAVTGPGVVMGVLINSHTSGTLKLWNNNGASTTALTDTLTFAAGERFVSFGTDGIDFDSRGIFATVGGTLNCQLLINPA